MSFNGPYASELALLALFVFVVVLHFACEGVILATGMALVKLLSVGTIRIGERRSLMKSAPKVHGGQVFYYEDGAYYMYQNFAQLIGFLFWLVVLLVLIRIGVVQHG
jgi:hypothetical protein